MLNKNPKKMLMKFSSWLSCLGIATVMVFSLVASLMIATPQTAHAATLPAYRYTRTFDTSASGAYAQGFGVATDAQGSIYVTGDFSGTVVFDGTGGSDSRTAGGGNEGFFITKYNADGTYAYTKTFDTSANGGTFADGYGIATDGQGNVYVTGDWQGTVVFDGTGGSDSRTSTNYNGFLTKYNADGTYAYTKTFDTSASSNTYAYGQSVATDAQGNVYVTGEFQGTVVFDGVGGSDSQTEANGSSFLTKYNANGTYAYTKTTDVSPGGPYARGYGVAIDAQGNIYVAGFFHGAVTFDGPGGSDTQTDGGGDRDTFLTKYNANGTYAFTKTFDTSAAGGTFAIGNGIATDAQGNVYVTGEFQGTVVFDGTGGSDSQTEVNGSSFLTKYNANGSYAFTKTFDTSAGSAQGNGVTTDRQGDVYVTGRFSGTVVFDGTGGSDSQAANSNGGFFLTSFQVFIPGQSSSPAATTASATVPGAPNTGFGVITANPIQTFLLYSLISSALVISAIAYPKLTSRIPNIKNILRK